MQILLVIKGKNVRLGGGGGGEITVESVPVESELSAGQVKQMVNVAEFCCC